MLSPAILDRNWQTTAAVALSVGTGGLAGGVMLAAFPAQTLAAWLCHRWSGLRWPPQTRPSIPGRNQLINPLWTPQSRLQLILPDLMPTCPR